MADLVRKDTGADTLCFGADKRELKEVSEADRPSILIWKQKGGRNVR